MVMMSSPGLAVPQSVERRMGQADLGYGRREVPVEALRRAGLALVCSEYLPIGRRLAEPEL